MDEPICTVAGCEREPYLRGWCLKHYRRWRKHGSTELPKRPTPQERFYAKVRPQWLFPDSCFIWVGCRDKRGYGRFYDNTTRSARFAHRWIYEQHHGSTIPSDLEVCHRCDNPACVRVDHLFLGTHRENMRDAHAKGRVSGQKLTPGQHAEIRQRYTGAVGQQAALAREFGVSQWHISYLVNGHRWKRKPAT